MHLLLCAINKIEVHANEALLIVDHEMANCCSQIENWPTWFATVQLTLAYRRQLYFFCFFLWAVWFCSVWYVQVHQESLDHFIYARKPIVSIEVYAIYQTAQVACERLYRSVFVVVFVVSYTIGMPSVCTIDSYRTLKEHQHWHKWPSCLECSWWSSW